MAECVSRPELSLHRFRQPFSTDHEYFQYHKSIGNPTIIKNV